MKKIDASEGRSVPPERRNRSVLKYMRIPSTAGTRDPERGRIFSQALSAR